MENVKKKLFSEHLIDVTHYLKWLQQRDLYFFPSAEDKCSNGNLT